MTDIPTGWKDVAPHTRMRTIVETLNTPAPAATIADDAGVEESEASEVLSRLVDLDIAIRVEPADEAETDNEVRYYPNRQRLVFDQIRELINDFTNAEMESRVEELREKLAKARDVADSEEGRQARHAEQSIGAIEYELMLTEHAISLYEDVTPLSGWRENEDSPPLSTFDGDERIALLEAEEDIRKGETMSADEAREQFGTDGK